jgi:hypothetical protein
LEFGIVFEEEVGNLEFAGYQDSSGYDGCVVAVIQSVVSCKED